MPRAPSNEAAPKKRTRLPMDKFRAAYAIDRILSLIPEADRATVLEFVRTPRQVTLPGVGNA
jgi:hypothetical protein